MGDCYEAQSVEGKRKSGRKDNSRVFIPGHVYADQGCFLRADAVDTVLPQGKIVAGI